MIEQETEDHLMLLNKLIKIPVIDNGENLVSLREFCPHLVIEINQLGEPNSNREPSVRKTVAHMLNWAHTLLPEGYRFKIWEAHRPIEKQEFMRRKFLEDLVKANPEKPIHELKKERDKYVARIDIIPPHLTGGAVDLTIVGPDNEDLGMGTDYLDFHQETNTFNHNISPEAKKNRLMLNEAMDLVGFVNYSYEWWHWSYGDRYWAYKTNNVESIYGPCESYEKHMHSFINILNIIQFS